MRPVGSVKLISAFKGKIFGGVFLDGAGREVLLKPADSGGKWISASTCSPAGKITLQRGRNPSVELNSSQTLPHSWNKGSSLKPYDKVRWKQQNIDNYCLAGWPLRSSHGGEALVGRTTLSFQICAGLGRVVVGAIRRSKRSLVGESTGSEKHVVPWGLSIYKILFIGCHLPSRRQNLVDEKEYKDINQHFELCNNEPRKSGSTQASLHVTVS